MRVFGCLGGGGGIGCSLHRRLSGVCGTEQLTASDEGASGSGRLRTHPETLFQHDRNAGGGEASSRRVRRPRRDTQRRQAMQKWADGSGHEHEQHTLRTRCNRSSTSTRSGTNTGSSAQRQQQQHHHHSSNRRQTRSRQGVAARDRTQTAAQCRRFHQPRAGCCLPSLHAAPRHTAAWGACRPSTVRMPPDAHARARPLCCMPGDRRSLGRV